MRGVRGRFEEWLPSSIRRAETNVWTRQTEWIRRIFSNHDFRHLELTDPVLKHPQILTYSVSRVSGLGQLFAVPTVLPGSPRRMPPRRTRTASRWTSRASTPRPSASRPSRVRRARRRRRASRRTGAVLAPYARRAYETRANELARMPSASHKADKIERHDTTLSPWY